MPRILCVLLLPLWLLAQNEYIVENGKTIILETLENNPQPLKILNKTYVWLTHPSNPAKKISFIGIPYRTKPINISLGNRGILKIQEGNYKKEQIYVSPAKAKPNKKNQERIRKERKETQEIYAIHTKERYWSEPFIYPVESKITSAYGNARVFNGEVSSYHSGTDFRAAVGTPIYASNSGKVVLAKERFLAGGSVIIDHGEGVFSMYYHCNVLKVKVGDRVNKGDLIALSGDSGRVSGPHLHFGFLVQGVQVDPLDFIHQINLLFED
ncbi:peptidoglycan metallopeptidase Pgp3 [Helicobacter mesocricetorum]|uniref:M23 family metallopeptidase n=1 Tax=Helicobacter mesocricetorum TaxID=87012 RepID=UPI000CF14FC9|nr:M23 family metallopeptidase [Helicobacter mesocricetorum]